MEVLKLSNKFHLTIPKLENGIDQQYGIRISIDPGNSTGDSIDNGNISIRKYDLLSGYTEEVNIPIDKLFDLIESVGGIRTKLLLSSQK